MKGHRTRQAAPHPVHAGAAVDGTRTADRFLAEHPELLDEDRFSPVFRRVIATLMAPWAAYHRLRVHGWERVPDGGCLMVANHSVGAVIEIMLLIRAWHMRYPSRPARGLAHQVAWRWPLKAFPVQKLGAIFAHPEVARRSLARGEALLVFPGGDLEACRPFYERYRVTLGGRTGFARLATASDVPIVPVVICGSHATYIALPGGGRFARLTPLGRFFGLKAFPVTAGFLGVMASAAAALAFPPTLPAFLGWFAAAVVPLPSKIEMEFLEPIWPREGETEAELAERVRAAMQEGMDRLAARRKTPWG